MVDIGATTSHCGGLVGIIIASLAWIGLLHRKVDQRTHQLKMEIHERESEQYRRFLEEERSRIARDLHDDLGASLTEISMLAETGRDRCSVAVDLGKQFDRILERARALVRVLDEIVGGRSPHKDTLQALIRYLAGFARRIRSCGWIGLSNRAASFYSGMPDCFARQASYFFRRQRNAQQCRPALWRR